jgi:hypothetical protein
MMTSIEILTSAAALLTAGVGVAYVVYLVRSSGRDRRADPVRVQRLIDTAPYERLDGVLAKPR